MHQNLRVRTQQGTKLCRGGFAVTVTVTYWHNRKVSWSQSSSSSLHHPCVLPRLFSLLKSFFSVCVKFAPIGKGNICPRCRPKAKKKLPPNDIDDEVCEAKGARQQGWRRRCWCPYQAGTWCQVGWAGGGHYRTQSPNIGHCCLEIRVLWNTGILFFLDQNMNSPRLQYCTLPFVTC